MYPPEHEATEGAVQHRRREDCGGWAAPHCHQARQHCCQCEDRRGPRPNVREPCKLGNSDQPSCAPSNGLQHSRNSRPHIARDIPKHAPIEFEAECSSDLSCLHFRAGHHIPAGALPGTPLCQRPHRVPTHLAPSMRGTAHARMERVACIAMSMIVFQPQDKQPHQSSLWITFQAGTAAQ